MATLSDRLHRAQQDFNAVITVIPFDEHAVDESPTLMGQPVAFKDIVDVAGVDTTCGTKVKVGRAPVKDAPVVQRLTAKGALPVAKATAGVFLWHFGRCLGLRSRYQPTRSRNLRRWF